MHAFSRSFVSNRNERLLAVYLSLRLEKGCGVFILGIPGIFIMTAEILHVFNSSFVHVNGGRLFFNNNKREYYHENRINSIMKHQNDRCDVKAKPSDYSFKGDFFNTDFNTLEIPR